MTTMALLALFTLLVLLLSPGRAWENLLSTERNALVFEGRHRAYGAYRLRRRYPFNLAMALLAVVGLAGGAALGARMLAHSIPAVKAPPSTEVVIDLTGFIDLPSLPPPSETPKAEVVVPPKPGKDEGLVPVEAAVDSLVPARPMVVDSTLFGTGPDPDDGGNATGNGGPTDGEGAGSGGEGSVGGTGADGPVDPYKEFEVDVLPLFPGGEAGLRRWIDRHLDVPDGLRGREEAYVQFTVAADGTVHNVIAVKGSNGQFNAAVEHTVRRMPRWRPASRNGHQVPCRLTLPVRLVTR